MSVAANKRAIRDYYETVLNAGEVDALEELAVRDYIDHDPFPEQGTGRDGLREKVMMLRDVLTPYYTIEDIVAEGETVAVRWTCTGTQRGEIFGIPATHMAFTIAGVDFHLMRDGMMAEHWHVIDQLAFLQQLGVVPAP